MAENTKDDEPLEVYWDALRLIRGEPESTVPEFGDLAEANDLVIGTSKKRILVIIKATGEIQYGPEYHPDEAAMIFWEHMGQRRLAMEERLLIIGHMESLLVQLGVRDMECERLRRAAAGEQDPFQKASLEQSAEIALRRLEAAANQAIELGRGLARRPEVAVPQMPPGVPRTLLENPNTNYQGQEGLEPDPPPPDPNRPSN